MGIGSAGIFVFEDMYINPNLLFVTELKLKLKLYICSRHYVHANKCREN